MGTHLPAQTKAPAPAPMANHKPSVHNTSDSATKTAEAREGSIAKTEAPTSIHFASKSVIAKTNKISEEIQSMIEHFSDSPKADLAWAAFGATPAYV